MAYLRALLRLNVASLDLGHTAIDEKLYARDIARLVGSQEGDNCRDLVGVAHPAQRNSFREALFHRRERVASLQTFQDWSLDVAGADSIHANAALTEFVGSGARTIERRP